MKKLLTLIILMCLAPISVAEPTFNANFFTHFEAAQDELKSTDDVSWGESALFLNGSLSPKLSYLVETSYLAPAYRDKTLAIERIQLRYEIDQNHSFSVGKIHTPVNDWNDSFHHGRIFFPTINRPLAFKRFIPIHEIGARLSGHNLWGGDFGYEVVIGSGQSAGDDAFINGIKSQTYALRWQPRDMTNLLVSYYRDELTADDAARRAGIMNMGGQRAGEAAQKVEYELFSVSATQEINAWTLRLEASKNRTENGQFNEAAFLYSGYQLNENHIVYGLYDEVSVKDGEVFFRPGIERRYGFGYQYHFNINTTLKIEARQHTIAQPGTDRYEDTELQMQVAFGF